jgi:hypothetical protein
MSKVYKYQKLRRNNSNTLAIQNGYIPQQSTGTTDVRFTTLGSAQDMRDVCGIPITPSRAAPNCQ